MHRVEARIVNRLLNDSIFGFRENGHFLQGGICPDCHKKELFISKEKPYVLKCNRLNQCGYEENTRSIYPEIFQQFSKLYPTTPKNPQATADAYLQFDRQFDITKIKDWYSQESYRLPNSNNYVDTVRFYFDDDKTRYWERLIDQSKADGQRHNISGKRKIFAINHQHHGDYNGSLYKGEWWKPKDIKFKRGDAIYLVEGIFHSLALHFIGCKSASIIAANNFPSLAIEPYLKKDITWRLALDDDKAGREYMLKHAKKLTALGEKVEFSLTGTKQDWDDLYRTKKLTKHFMNDCLYRGRLFGASDIKEKVYHWYCKNGGVFNVMDFNNKYFSISIDMKKLNGDLFNINDENEDAISIKDEILDDKGKQIFKQCVKITPIANCKPTFLYCEQQQITGDLAYFFSVAFPSMNERKISLSGSALESPASFNKALLNQAPGAGFDGASYDFKTIKNRWFNNGVLIVETVPFLGYDKVSESYIYNDWAYRSGRELKLNVNGYFEAGKHRIKSSFKSFQIQKSNQFNSNWLADFAKVFGNQGMVGLAFWFGSLFAQQIRAQLKDFPFLELTGEHGSGKSTLIEFLWKLIGRDDYEGFDPSKATFAARTRAFSQVSNMPIVLIESDRDDKAKKGAFDFEELKTAFNGRAIRSIGSFNRGNDIEEPSFNASIVIAQNAEVDGSPALLSRIVHCHCTKAHFTEKTKQLAPNFANATVEAMSGFLKTALSKEKEILEHFFSVFPQYEDELFKRNNIKDGRVIKTHAMVTAMASSLSFIFPSYSHTQNENLKNYLFERAEKRQLRMNADHPIVQQFWEIYDLINTASNNQKGFSLLKQNLNHSKKDDLIAINLNHFYQTCRERNVELINTSDLKKLLPSSHKHKFQTIKNVDSSILSKSVHCMVFKKGENL